MAVRHPTVAVVQGDQQTFFLCFNKRWRGYAFPIRKPRRGEMLADVAREAFADDYLQQLPAGADGKPLEFVAAYGVSQNVGEESYYDCHVFEVEPGPGLPEATSPVGVGSSATTTCCSRRWSPGPPRSSSGHWRSLRR